MGKEYWFLCKPIFMEFLFQKFQNEMISYLFQFSYGYQNIVSLARLNRPDLCEIVYSNTRKFNAIDMCVDEASSKGNLQVVQYLTLMGASCSSNAMNYAAQYGHLETVKWLHENRSEGCLSSAMELASQNGHLETLKWLYLKRSDGCSNVATLRSVASCKRQSN